MGPTIDVAFVVVWAFVLSGVAALYFALADSFKNPYDRGLLPSILLIFGMAAWPLLGALCTAIVFRLGDRPYGIRPRQVFQLVMIGPLRTEIDDHDATAPRR
jgi:hypothetical protein